MLVKCQVMTIYEKDRDTKTKSGQNRQQTVTMRKGGDCQMPGDGNSEATFCPTATAAATGQQTLLSIGMEPPTIFQVHLLRVST